MFNFIKSYFLSFILKIFLNSIFMTCSWHILNKKDFDNALNNPRPLLLCLWHSRSLFVAKYFKYNKILSWAISSTHPDSEIFARVLKSWNIKLIRGSSSRGWMNVLKKMIPLFQDPSTIITVTLDGPKGPRKKAKIGTVRLAKKNNVQVLAVSAIANNVWQIPSWDKTKLPMPFSKIFIRFSPSLFAEQKINSLSLSSFINKNQTALDNHVNKLH